jgi:hypothetical protein
LNSWSDFGVEDVNAIVIDVNARMIIFFIV